MKSKCLQLMTSTKRPKDWRFPNQGLITGQILDMDKLHRMVGPLSDKRVPENTAKWEKKQLLPTSVHKWKAYYLRAHVCRHLKNWYVDQIDLHHGHIFTSWKRGHVVDMDWPEVQLPNDSVPFSRLVLQTSNIFGNQLWKQQFSDDLTCVGRFSTDSTNKVFVVSSKTMHRAEKKF